MCNTPENGKNHYSRLNLPPSEEPTNLPTLMPITPAPTPDYIGITINDLEFLDQRVQAMIEHVSTNTSGNIPLLATVVCLTSTFHHASSKIRKSFKVTSDCYVTNFTHLQKEVCSIQLYYHFRCHTNNFDEYNHQLISIESV